MTVKPAAGAGTLSVTVMVETLPLESKSDVGEAPMDTLGKSSLVIVPDALDGEPTAYPDPLPKVTVAVAGPSNATVLVAEIAQVPVPLVDTLTVAPQPFVTPVIAPVTEELAIVTAVVTAGAGEIVTVKVNAVPLSGTDAGATAIVAVGGCGLSVALPEMFRCGVP